VTVTVQSMQSDRLMAKTNISSIREAMEQRGLRPRKKYGQNFLKERGLLELMVREGGVEPGDVVLEIGSGPGCLTEALCEAGARVVAVDVDAGLMDVARDLLGTPEGVCWIHADILESKSRINPRILELLREEMAAAGKPDFKLIANLPYNVSVPVMVNLLESRQPCGLMVVTVQDEVADRLLAAPGAADYGLVSAVVSLLAGVRRIRRIGAAAFWPRPQVSSSVLKIRPLAEVSLGAVSYGDFKRTARGIFAHRRKVWLKSLLASLGLEERARYRKIFTELGFDVALRGESLSPSDMVRIAAVLRARGVFEDFQDNCREI